MSRTPSNAILVAFALLAIASFGAAAQPAGRNFDARVDLNAGVTIPPGPEQLAKIENLRGSLPSAAIRIDSVTGATQSLSNHNGYLSEARGGSASLIASDFVNDRLDLLGLEAGDVAEWEISDEVFSRVTGATHVYFQQKHQGLAVYNGQLQVNVNRVGRVLGVNSSFLPAIAKGARDREPLVTLDEAITRAARHTGIDASNAVTADARLVWLPIRRGDARLAWNFQLDGSEQSHYYDVTVDAQSGKVWTSFDWVADGSYKVYEQPVEDPGHTSPAPPTDARTVAVNPEDTTASPPPSGWFTGGVVDGNNVHACIDAASNNVCDFQTDCGGTTCDFPIALGSAPSAYQDASVTNLFYWNNIIHDVQYQYGFDEVGGNFQEDNFANGGSGSDSVNADAQDGGGNCNANFGTPPDGSNPRMQMYTCTNVNPARDGDLDNGVIVHEYGHGISNRQVGGPNNTSCLGNRQQMGEGWSDFLALAYTGEVGDAGTDARGIGTYLFGQAPNGPGIRTFPYSTDFNVNPDTFSDIGSRSIPHGIGSVWAEIVWEAYWELVDFHGFSANLYDANGGSGNQRMMLYVNEGMKSTACKPTFLDARDGILQAANDNYGAEDVCRLWTAFARRGLGEDASTGGSNSTMGSDGFAVPAFCSGPCEPTGTEAGNCDDGIDNDCNALTDCDDTIPCGSDPVCAVCTGGQNGDSCNFDSDCCSNKCKNGSCRGN